MAHPTSCVLSHLNTGLLEQVVSPTQARAMALKTELGTTSETAGDACHGLAVEQCMQYVLAISTVTCHAAPRPAYCTVDGSTLVS